LVVWSDSGMSQPSSRPPLYKGCRFPSEVISHGVWLYYRFAVSLRDVSELLLARSIEVSHDPVRLWTVRFGLEYARRLRRTREPCSTVWHLDELCLMINGKRGWLWRAVDDAGEVLDILVQRRRSARAAKRFFRKLLTGLRMVPRAIVTDRLASDAAAKAAVLSSVAHLRRWRQNNRVENSHQPVRRRERGLQRFKSLRYAARFCSVSSMVGNQFRPGRHVLSAANYRTVRRRRWREWDAVSETTAFAAAA
jgi:putative transposase